MTGFGRSCSGDCCRGRSAENPCFARRPCGYWVLANLLWVVFLIVLLVFLGRKTLVDLLSRARKIQVGGFSVELAAQVEKELAKKHVRVTAGVKAGIADSLERLSASATGTRILWIDPHPTNNTVEIRTLTRLGAAVDLARSDDDARTCLRGAVYDIVLSNMTRDDDERAGAVFLPEIHAAMGPPSVIYYVGRHRQTPEGAFGLTTRPDELFRLVLQALEYTGGA